MIGYFLSGKKYRIIWQHLHMPKSPISLKYQTWFTESSLEWICGGDQAYFQISTNKQTCLNSVVTGKQMLQSSLFCYCNTHTKKISSSKEDHRNEGETRTKMKKVLKVGKEQLCAFFSVIPSPYTRNKKTF